MHKFIRFINTVKYLKYTQLIYQVFYKFRSELRRRIGFQHILTRSSRSFGLEFDNSIVALRSKTENNFCYLNLSHEFSNQIDWNFPEYGKLWTYNLCYFDFLQQKEIDKNSGLKLIHDFIDQLKTVKDGLEPYPISLRGMNWIKFLTRNKIKDQRIDDALLAQYHILMDNIEYHLMGNHLLENGFSLLFGAYYFQDEKLYNKANNILVKELKEQILEDGAHFELSPMYHQLMLFRVMDCINLVKNNSFKNKELLSFFQKNAQRMLKWLNKVTFKNGNVPNLNDSVFGIAPTTEQLNSYGSRLGIVEEPIILHNQLRESGYRKYANDNFEMIIDVGNIGPDYIPGHAHADTFNFELYIDERPFIVDTGISTYEKNELRQLERSTESHNSVTVNGENQSQVWGGFRVAKRARIIELKESKNQMIASHDGYKNVGVVHQRAFNYENKAIKIIDKLIGKEVKGKAYFHIHPSIHEVDIINCQVRFKDIDHQINFSGTEIKIEKHDFNYATGFNKTIKGIVLEVTFSKHLNTIISSIN